MVNSYNTVGYARIVPSSKNTVSHIQTHAIQYDMPTETIYEGF